ncbi:alpha/beta fold hydrolase [Peribacillus kribbensis]|uniref:alpha/beta fold hydrolase n=1 Tax=Peribacillus kribbensis TaxID=356658 RepID=UPI0004095AA4|nr:alpha/beta hydrolase [Peribacillus kribbensis]
MLKYVSINGKVIEVLHKGDKGSTLLILTGMGCSFDEWDKVTEILGKNYKVIMFHRPGLGNSEIGSETRNTEVSSREIIELLNCLGVKEPILLVGHSYGGLCAQHFVKLYPELVAGMLLVDSTSVVLRKLDELDLPILNDESTDEVWKEKCKHYSKMRSEDLKQLLNPTVTEKQQQLSPRIQERLIEFQINPNLYKAMKSEIENWKRDAEIIKDLGSFPNIPLIVIGRDKNYNISLGINEGIPEPEIKIFEEEWHKLIKEQALLSRNSTLIFADQSTHSIHLDNPEVIIESINRISVQIRTFV